MPQPRKSNRVLEASGAFRKNPDRKREAPAPQAGDLGELPDHLAEDERKAWTDIAETAPKGVLTRSDRVAVELAAGLLAKQRRGEAGPTEMGHLRAFLAKFAQTPGDRESMGLGGRDDEPNPFGEIEAAKGGNRGKS